MTHHEVCAPVFNRILAGPTTMHHRGEWSPGDAIQYECDETARVTVVTVVGVAPVRNGWSILEVA